MTVASCWREVTVIAIKQGDKHHHAYTRSAARTRRRALPDRPGWPTCRPGSAAAGNHAARPANRTVGRHPPPGWQPTAGTRYGDAVPG